MGDALLEDVRTATCQDCNLQELKELVVVGWPSSHKKSPQIGCPEDLKLSDDFIMKGEALVVPKQHRAEILRRVHDTVQMGIEACLRRARGIFYWPLDWRKRCMTVMSCVGLPAKPNKVTEEADAS